MLATQAQKALSSLRWLPAYGWQQLARRPVRSAPAHLILCLADHFEPAFRPDAPHLFADLPEQERRLERWCREYPTAVGRWRDADGQPLRHTYFYPAEQYEKSLVERLAEHCHAGWGEIETHLHHGVQSPDTAANTRRVLEEFRDALVEQGCLSRWDGEGPARYAFVHGNWTLANSGNGVCCGVDEEMQLLAETGCYADMTLPSAPNPAQTSKINALYECARPLARRAPHRSGRDLRRGRAPETFPLIVQGPLGLDFSRKIRGLPVPYIENGEVTTKHPLTMRRLELWRRAAITVRGRPDWVFVKLHCHGMDTRDEEAMLGGSVRRFLQELTDETRRAAGPRLHFVTAREMVNIMLAACDGREGAPGEFRDYRLKLIKGRLKV
ncbi:MAG TPA: hypothetical protein VF538_15705 [Pyrinomonadaceae bacterium]|jgi:hypothetical protein